MTWDPRFDVVEQLEAAGWVGDEENPLGLLRCNGAVWGVTSNGGDSSLTEPVGGQTIGFPASTAPAVIVAACLAAAGGPSPDAWSAEDAQRIRAAVVEVIEKARPLPAAVGETVIDVREQLSELLALVDYLTARVAAAEAAGAVCDTEGHAIPRSAGCPDQAPQLEDLVHTTGRLRAARRQPHEREGLIFHLERENRRVHDYVRVANEAAQVAHRSWEEAVEEAKKLRERNGELLARIDILRKRLENLITEYRLPPAPPAFTPLIVRRDPAYDGTRWAVLHDPGDNSVRRAWTDEGWQMAWSLTHDELFCWPNSATAMAQARRAQGAEDDPDTDGAGRTPESYRTARSETPAP